MGAHPGLQKEKGIPNIEICHWTVIQDLKNKEKRDPNHKILPDRHPRIENRMSEQEEKRERRKY